MEVLRENRSGRHGSLMGARRLCVLLTAGLFCGPAVKAQPASEMEYRVKAAFLYNFTKFVEWPERALPSSDEPVAVCVPGKDPFGEVLEQTLQNKTFHGLPSRSGPCPPEKNPAPCHLSFVSSSESERLSHVLTSTAPSPVLTVGGVQGFAEQGGIINLFLEEGTVGFEVNVDAVERAGLRISSQLLRLARIVRGPAGRRKG